MKLKTPLRPFIFAVALAICLIPAALAQLFNASRLASFSAQTQAVFDNGGASWPFFNQIPSINYDTGGSGLGYVATPVPNCPTNGSSYRQDYINFNPDTGQSVPYRIGCFLAGQIYRTHINISQAGPYQINLNIANGGGSTATVSVILDGTQVATIAIPVSGSYSTFVTNVSGQFSASIGNHTLGISCLTGDSINNGCGDMRWFQGSAAGSLPSVPVAAQNAGLTTLARNWDFTQPQYATQSAWLDCNGNDATKEWHKGSPGEFNALPCDINQGLDDQGSTVLVFNFPASYSTGTPGHQPFVSMQTALFSPAAQTAFPNGSYIEIDVKESASGIYNNGNNNSSGPDSLYTATTDMTDNNAMLLRPQWIEHDPGELWLSAGSFGNGNLMVYPEQSPGGVWFSYNSTNNLPPGWSVTGAYHKYAVMSTVNTAGTSMYSCLFVDGILQQQCYAMDLAANPLIPFYPQRIIIWSGGSAVAVNKKMYVRTVRAWSCPSWASQMTDHGNVYCGGSTLSDNGTLRYWH